MPRPGSCTVTATPSPGAATLLTAGLVIALSIRLRRAEIMTLARIGASRGRIAAILSAEVLSVVAAGLVVATLFTWVTATFGADALHVRV